MPHSQSQCVGKCFVCAALVHRSCKGDVHRRTQRLQRLCTVFYGACCNNLHPSVQTGGTQSAKLMPLPLPSGKGDAQIPTWTTADLFCCGLRSGPNPGLNQLSLSPLCFAMANHGWHTALGLLFLECNEWKPSQNFPPEMS